MNRTRLAITFLLLGIAMGIGAVILFIPARRLVQKYKQVAVDTSLSFFTPTKEKNDGKVIILRVPNENQPEITPASHYWNQNGDLVVLISNTITDWREVVALSFHEQIEAAQSVEDGVPLKAILDFDRAWNQHDSVNEPGADPKAPYFKEHKTGLRFEKMVIELFPQINWDEYNDRMEKAQWGPTPTK